jgi:hypothetical protein
VPGVVPHVVPSEGVMPMHPMEDLDKPPLFRPQSISWARGGSPQTVTKTIVESFLKTTLSYKH